MQNQMGDVNIGERRAVTGACGSLSVCSRGALGGVAAVVQGGLIHRQVQGSVSRVFEQLKLCP